MSTDAYPFSDAPLKWGILGPGKIARPFCEGIARLPHASVVAVGSRSRERADALADAFAIPHRYGSYEELVSDPEVEAVYVATPHPMHRDHCLLAINAGKAVLCEKPFTVNAREAEEIAHAARAQGVFVLEAMKTRFFPTIRRVRELLAEGVIGEVRMLQGEFGFRTGFDPQSRLLDPALGGGALLDVGVYCVSFASMLFGGEPEQVTSLASRGETGVDEQSAFLLGYSGGRIAVLSSAVRTRTRNEVMIYGTDGWIQIHAGALGGPRAYTLSRDNERVELPIVCNGFDYEADEVAVCLREGKTESPILPLDESIGIMRTLDRIRAPWGLRYAAD